MTGKNHVVKVTAITEASSKRKGNFRTTIPKFFIDLLGLKKGDKLTWIIVPENMEARLILG